MPRLSDFDSHTPDSRPSHPDTAAAPSAQTLVPSTAPPKENRKRDVWRRATRRKTVSTSPTERNAERSAARTLRGERSNRNSLIIALLLLGLTLGAALSPHLPGASGAGPCDAPANEVVAENCQPGSPESEWDVSGAGDASIQGFAADFSVDQGQTVDFKIKTDATELPPRHLPHGLLRRDGRAQSDDRSTFGIAAAGPARLCERLDNRPH